MISGCVTVTGPPVRICRRNVDDGARAVEHVAEANHGEDRRAAIRAPRLQHQLGQALAGAHDVGWTHRLVGGDQHHELDAGGLAHSASTAVPNVLFRSPHTGFCSTMGTCL